ncbi:MAG: radical SAM protein [Promethearchaeati archaeon SRVP18_Atabeyarchaeia-1]
MSRMGADVALLYPYFRPPRDSSPFRFPPLGLGYIAAYLKKHNFSVSLVDCTFATQGEALKRVRDSHPRIIGIYSMYSMKEKAMEMADLLRGDCELLITGGPLPSVNPKEFLGHFDVVVIGEGEQTTLELVKQFDRSGDLSRVRGIMHKKNGRVNCTGSRPFIQDLDSIPFPSRELFDNDSYKAHYSKIFGYTMTSLMSSRGCPFNCDFCSRPIFGNTLRARSATNVVDEIEQVKELGYQRIWFADDCFTLNHKRLLEICHEMIQRGIKVEWECLSRVDTVNKKTADMMKLAGCRRVFFGIESGNDRVLSLMKKQITTEKAKKAVKETKQSGIEVGAFFIVGYPGETSETILDTVNFASELPLDYLSFTMPYAIPGTSLYDRVRDRLISDEWEEPRSRYLVKHKLLICSPFSEGKLKVAILKGMIQFELRKYLGNRAYKLIGVPLEKIMNYVYKALR